MKGESCVANVTVIVPCYRCADTIERAVESISKQTLMPYEVILVDDCSCDGTLEILYKLQAQYGDEWIKVISLATNSGPGSARNVGWDLSKQDYVAFLDADDTWHPQKIEIQYEWMLDNEDVVISGHDFSYLKDITEKYDVYDLNSLEFCEVSKYKLLFKNVFSTPSIILKKSIAMRFPERTKYCEDYHLWTHIAFCGYKCFKVNIPLAYLYKPPYGSAGLSADLWGMEKGELDVYKSLLNKKLINKFQYLFFLSFSLMKFVKRLVY